LSEPTQQFGEFSHFFLVLFMSHGPLRLKKMCWPNLARADSRSHSLSAAAARV
jgi:hypothetical protein